MPDENCIKEIIKINDTERRSRLTDDEIEIIADRIQSKMYEHIGKNVVSKLFWIIGIVTVSIGVYLKSKGI